MAGTLDRPISYRRAQWHKAALEGDHLEDIVKKAYAKLNKSNLRTVERNEKKIKCGKPEIVADGGILLHYTADTPGEFASVVRHSHDDDDDVITDVMEPIPNTEFLDAEVFVFIVEDNVLICTSRLREQAVRFILAKTIEKAGMSDDALAFELRAAANLDKIDMIHRSGVAEVDLRVSMYSASQSYSERTLTTSSLLSGIAGLLQRMGGFEDDPEDDNLKVSLVLKGDARNRSGITAGQKKIDALAEKIIETADDDDDFRIKTQSGATISQHEIYIRGVATVEKSGKSLVRASVWDELKRYHKEIKGNGALEK